MNKRILSLISAVILLLAVVCTAAVAEEETAEEAGTYYVYTENGKGLNVRSTPGGTVVGSLKNGSSVRVDAFVDDNWALITYHYDNPGFGVGDYAAYINRRYLTKTKSTQRKANTDHAVATTLDEINSEFRSARKVEPYKVQVRPTRVSGWVNMRWAPSKSSELMATYKANSTLTVIKELTNWVQVEDPDTGDVGFINRVFIAQ